MIAESSSSAEMAVPPTHKGLGDGVRSLLRNGAWLLGANWLATLLRLVYVAVLARWLGPDGFGLISTLQASYLAILAFATAGLPAFLSRERTRKETLSGILGTVFTLHAGGLLACGLIFVALAGSAGASLSEWGLIGLFGGALILRGLAIAVGDTFTAHEQSAMVLKLVGTFRTVEIVAGIAVLLAGGDVLAVALVHLVSWAFESGAGLWQLRSRLGHFGRPKIDRAILATLAVPMFGVGLALAAGHAIRAVPMVLVRYSEANAEAIGQFALAWNAALMLATLTVSVLAAAFPVIGRAHLREDGKDVQYLDFCVRYGLLAGIAAGLAAFWLGELAMRLVGGAEYESAAGIFRLSACAIGPAAASFAVDQILFVKGKSRWLLILNVAAIALLAAGFVPVFNLWGGEAAAGLGLGVICLALAGKLVVLKQLAGASALGGLIRAGLVALAVLAVLWLTGPFGEVGKIAAAISAVLAASLLTGAVKPSEWQGVLGALRPAR